MPENAVLNAGFIGTLTIIAAVDVPQFDSEGRLSSLEAHIRQVALTRRKPGRVLIERPENQVSGE